MTEIIKVDGMSCAHCEKAVASALAAFEGVSEVVVSLGDKTVRVEFDPGLIALDDLRREIEEEGYTVIYN